MSKQVKITIGIVRGNRTFFYDWKSCKLQTEAEVQAFIKEHTDYCRIARNAFVKKCEVYEVAGKAGER